MKTLQKTLAGLTLAGLLVGCGRDSHTERRSLEKNPNVHAINSYRLETYGSGQDCGTAFLYDLDGDKRIDEVLIVPGHTGMNLGLALGGGYQGMIHMANEWLRPEECMVLDNQPRPLPEPQRQALTMVCGSLTPSK